jgi:hypothetical protein
LCLAFAAAEFEPHLVERSAIARMLDLDATRRQALATALREFAPSAHAATLAGRQVLYIGIAEDGQLSRELQQQLVDALPGARVEWVPGRLSLVARHVPQIVALLHGFLRETPVRSAR